jgi:HAD superfamily hydrolase (TIGR01484 family)
MKPLSELRDAGGLRGLLFDIDDTLTTDGRLTAEAYAALAALKRAGRIVVPITGRPAGWCDQIARLWPVDAVVGENGAFYFSYADGKLQQRFQDADDVRARNRGRLESIGARILKAVPGCALASDQPYRATDLAIDYCEDVPALPLETATRIAGLMRAEGLTAKVSSIHVNGWFGSYDKLTMARQLFSERFGIGADELRSRFAFAGDSPNDAPMFAWFENSVGVANVARYAGILEAEPKYVTQGFAGTGFAELAAHLLAPGPGPR